MKLSTEEEKYIMIAVLAWDWTDTEALLVQKTLNSVIYWSNVLAPIFNMDYPFKYKMSGDNNIFEIIEKRTQSLEEKGYVRKATNIIRTEKKAFDEVENLIGAGDFRFSKYDQLIKDIVSCLGHLNNDYIDEMFANDVFKEQNKAIFRIDDKGFDLERIKDTVKLMYTEGEPMTNRTHIFKYLFYHEVLVDMKRKGEIKQ